jgi:hypothetical protein
MTSYSVEFTATSTTGMRLQLSGLFINHYVEIDNISLDKRDGYAIPINLSDTYESALRYYVLHRCYEKDAAISPLNADRSIEYWNLFVTELGRLDLIRKRVSPNIRQPRPSPSLEEK